MNEPIIVTGQGDYRTEWPPSDGTDRKSVHASRFGELDRLSDSIGVVTMRLTSDPTLTVSQKMRLLKAGLTIAKRLVSDLSETIDDMDH